MNIRRNMLIAASAMALAASPAFAGDEKKDGEKMDPGKKFETIDADSNGSLTMDEMKAYYEGKGKDTAKLEEKFGKKDSDGNGEVSREEWDAAYAPKEEEKKEEKAEEKKDGGEG